MIGFRRYLTENKVHDWMKVEYRAAPLEVYRVSTAAGVLSLLRKHSDIRGIIRPESRGSIDLWNGYAAIHDDYIKHYGSDGSSWQYIEVHISPKNDYYKVQVYGHNVDSASKIPIIAKLFKNPKFRWW